jgi:hypothetical protein
MEQLAYKKPRQNKHKRSTLRLNRSCSFKRGAMGTTKMMKSVMMFMQDVRYQTGRELMQFLFIAGSKFSSGMQEKATMNLRSI